MPGLLTKGARAARLRFGRPFLERANRHRDRAEWFEAAVGYRRALEWLSWRHDLYVQLGNCLKELGDYRSAVNAYRAVETDEHRAEAARQIAETDRLASFDALPNAAGDRPDGCATEPLAPWNGRIRAADLPNRIVLDAVESRRRLGTLGGDLDTIAADRRLNHPTIILDQVGAMALTRDGISEPLLAGVVAVRARIAALPQLETVELWLGEVSGATFLSREPVRSIHQDSALALHVLNAWIDSARLPPGRHWLEVRAGDYAPATGLFVTVGDPAAPATGFDQSDAYVPSAGIGDEDPATALLARPAEARPAARSLFDRPIKSVLAIRADQLGDVSMSLPALARLRALFPEARLSVLVQPAVRAVIEASGLTDEVLTVDIHYDASSGRRFLPSEEEARLVAVCATRSFDLAIDLCPGDELRPLLLLTGATWLIGFEPDRFPYLDFGISVRSRDKVNQLANASHASTVSALIEGLAAAITSVRPVVSRRASSYAALAAHRLTPETYVVIHLGARIALNRWPADRFLAVAERLLVETTLDVVIFADDPSTVAATPLRANERVRILSVIDAYAFDAILSNARLMIANDSGPKHLAAVRGVETISVHAGKLNWSEWGQDGRGTILSKRVPCVGCGLNDIQLCGRDAVCLRSIGADEVLAAARRLLSRRAPEA